MNAKAECGCTLYELNSLRCKWPLAKFDDRPPYLFCGAVPTAGSPYCLEHTKRAITAPNPRVIDKPIPRRYRS